MAIRDSRCENCLYWTDRNIIGVCQRYPQPVNKHKIEWCGEFKSLPTTEIVKIETKRRGRPAKVENAEAAA